MSKLIPMYVVEEDDDGVFRPYGHGTPLPYGLPVDPQEPYVAIIAPNIDKISAGAFASKTIAGRRTRRGLIACAASITGGMVIIGLVVVVQWAMTLFGLE